MKTILVWYLVSLSSHGTLTYSPPMSTMEECERVKKVVPTVGHALRCVQINEVVK